MYKAGSGGNITNVYNKSGTVQMPSFYAEDINSMFII